MDLTRAIAIPQAHLDLLRLLKAYVGVAGLDQLDGERVQVVEALAGIGGPGGRPPHPLDVLVDGLDVLVTLGLGFRNVMIWCGRR